MMGSPSVITLDLADLCDADLEALIATGIGEIWWCAGPAVSQAALPDPDRQEVA